MELDSDNHPSDINNLTYFEKCMLKEKNINLSKIKSSKIKERILNKFKIYAIVDLYLNIKLILYKNYLSNELGVEFTDEEIFDMASPIVSKKLNYNSNEIDNFEIATEDSDLIDYYTRIINELNNNGIIISTGDYKEVFPNYKSIKHRYSEKAYIEHINLLNKLNKQGISEYTKKVVHNTLGKELIKSEDFVNIMDNEKVLYRKKQLIR